MMDDFDFAKEEINFEYFKKLGSFLAKYQSLNDQDLSELTGNRLVLIVEFCLSGEDSLLRKWESSATELLTAQIKASHWKHQAQPLPGPKQASMLQIFVDDMNSRIDAHEELGDPDSRQMVKDVLSYKIPIDICAACCAVGHHVGPKCHFYKDVTKTLKEIDPELVEIYSLSLENCKKSQPSNLPVDFSQESDTWYDAEIGDENIEDCETQIQEFKWNINFEQLCNLSDEYASLQNGLKDKELKNMQ